MSVTLTISPQKVGVAKTTVSVVLNNKPSRYLNRHDNKSEKRQKNLIIRPHMQVVFWQKARASIWEWYVAIYKVRFSQK